MAAATSAGVMRAHFGARYTWPRRCCAGCRTAAADHLLLETMGCAAVGRSFVMSSNSTEAWDAQEWAVIELQHHPCRPFGPYPLRLGVSSKQALPHAPSRGLVARTDALWNKLACPREPTGSLSEAIYSPHTQRLTAGPASRASGWPPNRGPKSLAQPERPAANPAGACDARRLRIKDISDTLHYT